MSRDLNRLKKSLSFALSPGKSGWCYWKTLSVLECVIWIHKPKKLTSKKKQRKKECHPFEVYKVTSTFILLFGECPFCLCDTFRRDTLYSSYPCSYMKEHFECWHIYTYKLTEGNLQRTLSVFYRGRIHSLLPFSFRYRFLSVLKVSTCLWDEWDDRGWYTVKGRGTDRRKKDWRFTQPASECNFKKSCSRLKRWRTLCYTFYLWVSRSYVCIVRVWDEDDDGGVWVAPNEETRKGEGKGGTYQGQSQSSWTGNLAWYNIWCRSTLPCKHAVVWHNMIWVWWWGSVSLWRQKVLVKESMHYKAVNHEEVQFSHWTSSSSDLKKRRFTYD